MTALTQPSLEDLKNYRAEHASSTEPYNPSLGQYAVSVPVMTYSMWTVLASLQHWIDIASNKAMLAESSMLATTSDLSATASENLSNKLDEDNANIQAIADEDDPDSNAMQAAQSQFSTDQTAYGVSVTDYQGSVQQWSQSLQTLTSSIASLVGMATQLEQLAWVPSST